MHACVYCCDLMQLQWLYVFLQLDPCVCTCMYMYCMYEYTRSGTTQHTPISTSYTACTIYIHIYSEHYNYIVCAVIRFLSSSSYDGTIKSAVFLNIRTLIRSCDEYMFVFSPPRPLSHCTLVLCCCVRRQSSPSPSAHSPDITWQQR